MSGMAAAMLSVALPAQGAYLDFTAAGAPAGTFGDGVFVQGVFGSGTGLFPAFVQLQKNQTDIVEGTSPARTSTTTRCY